MRKLFYILIALSVWACDEDDLTPSEFEPLYQIETTTDVGKSIAEIHATYNSYLLYDFDESDYKGSITYQNHVTIVPQESQEVINTSVEFAKEFFFELYDEEFMKEYAPFKVLLADTIKTTGFFPFPLDCYASYNFVAISNFRDDWQSMTDTEKNSFKTKIKKTFIKDYVIKYEHLTAPEEFGEVSKAHYGQWAPWGANFMEYGFWPEGYSFPRDANEDFGMYAEKMIELTDEEILSQIQGFPLMEEKYNIIKDWLVKNQIEL